MVLNPKILSLAVGSVLVIVFIFYVVSNAVPSWSRFSDGGTEATIGLWKRCGAIAGFRQCVDISCLNNAGGTTDFCSKILGARAFVTLACIISAITAACLLLSAITSDRTRRTLLILGKGLAFVSLILGIIGVAIGIDATTTDATVGRRLNLGAASIIGIIALIINLFGALGSLLIK